MIVIQSDRIKSIIYVSIYISLIIAPIRVNNHGIIGLIIPLIYHGYLQSSWVYGIVLPTVPLHAAPRQPSISDAAFGADPCRPTWGASPTPPCRWMVDFMEK